MGAHYVDMEEGITSLPLEKSLDLQEKKTLILRVLKSSFKCI